jgi:hypothetical protein
MYIPFYIQYIHIYSEIQGSYAREYEQYSSRFLQNFCKFLPHCTSSHHSRTVFSIIYLDEALEIIWIRKKKRRKERVFTNFFSNDATAPSGPGPPHYRGFTITLRQTTLGRTPLDEWSARRSYLYLTTYKTHNRYAFARRDSNPQSQHASGGRPTPDTARLLGSAKY